MAYFESAVITNDGKNMLMRDMIGIGNIEFVKMVAGAGEYSGEERKRNVIEQRTSLKDQRQEFPFNAIEIASEKSVLLKSVITNKDLEEGYRITEVGIYAREKGSDGEGILYSMDLAIEADFLPPYNGLNPTEITQEYYVTVSNASIVSIVSDEKTFALYDDLIALENKVTIMEENVGVFENSISDAFSKEKDYVRGDYTIYENTLYKFIDTKAAGEWDRNVVQAVTMSNELLVLQEKTEENKRLYEQVEFEDYSSNEQEIPETEEAIDQIVSGKSTKVLYQYIKAALKGLLALAKRALNIALGKNQARVFATVTALDTWLEVPENIAKLNIGDNFYITATDVPDYWWDGKQKQKLETQKVDLIPYDREIAALKQKDSELSGNISSHTHDGRYYTESEINTKLAGKSDTSHSHKYAGSSSAGGSATSAVKLDSSAGSAIQPLYFNDGKPVPCEHKLENKARKLTTGWGTSLQIPKNDGIHGFVIVSKNLVYFVWVAGNPGSLNVEKINLYKLGSTPDLNFSYNNATNILTISASDGNANTITYIGT